MSSAGRAAKARHSASARDELVNVLRRYSDAVQTPVTVVFDGTRTVTVRRLVPGKFSVPPGGAFSAFTAIARDFAGNDGRRLSSP